MKLGKMTKTMIKTGFTWTPELEIKLYYAMEDLKPAGVNKHFHMMVILKKLNEEMNVNVNSSDVWKHLESLYDLSAIDGIENSARPFLESREFILPDEEYKDLIKERTLMKVKTEAPDNDKSCDSKTPPVSKKKRKGLDRGDDSSETDSDKTLGIAVVQKHKQLRLVMMVETLVLVDTTCTKCQSRLQRRYKYRFKMPESKSWH
ncbi:unnamed protein product [Darwinula stevensoni]|uniref:Chromatin modification-related protein EAF7 n=1 Tax=Darwinula stevensoni TaxID=69355 RepID=A0A7R8XBR4_9CRUS|nr:unnamed protein product [Darwinula stevensoni]CAG0885095.1 unnamed protein product [Darwinula stevensoni]